MDKKYDVRIEIIEEIIDCKKEIKRLEEIMKESKSEQEKSLIKTSINTQKERLEKLENKKVDICNQLVEKKKKYEEKNETISKILDQLAKKKESLIGAVEEKNKDDIKSNKDLELQQLEEKIGKLEERLNKNKTFINEIDKTLKLMEYEEKTTKDEKKENSAQEKNDKKTNKKDEYEFNEVANIDGKIVKIAKMPDEQQDMENLTRYNLKIEEKDIDTYKDVYISKKIYLDKIDKDEKYKATIEEFFNPDRIAKIEEEAKENKSNRLYMGHINRINDENYKVGSYKGEKKNKIYNDFILNEYKDIQVLKNKTIGEIKKLDDNTPTKITQDKLATISHCNEQLEKIRKRRPDLFKKEEQKDNNENKVEEKSETPEEKAKRIGKETLNEMQHDYKNVHFTPEPLNENIINKVPIQKDEVQITSKPNINNEQEIEEFYEIKESRIKKFFGGIINNISRFFSNIKIGLKGLIGRGNTKLISAAQKSNIEASLKNTEQKEQPKQEQFEIQKVNVNVKEAIERMQEAMVKKESKEKTR